MASNGTYGTRIAANVSAEDVEIFYSYSPTRNSDNVNRVDFKKLDSSLLSDITDKSNNDDLIEGLKNLKLPLQYFNKKGFYSVYIRPREVHAVISNVSTLTTYPDVRGIVIDPNSVNDSSIRRKLQTNNDMVGYRIIYLSDNNKEREDYYRIITSNNKCETVTQNTATVTQNSNVYRFNEGGSLVFVTVTPSVSPTFKANALPYIGKADQEIILVNTKFEPILIDIEMIENDFDTISTALNGSQLRDLDNGLVTTYDRDNQIVLQHEHYTLKENSKPIFEVKLNKTDSIDFSQTLDDKLQ